MSSRARHIPLERDISALALLLLLLASMATHAQLRASTADAATTTAPLAACSIEPTEEERMGCVDLAAGRLFNEVGTVHALSAINAAARQDAWLARTCHMLMHERGREHEGTLTPGAVAHDGKDCAAGFLHGWMMANLGRDGNFDEATVRAWCSAPVTELERTDCEHGAGHVLVRNSDGNLRTSLARCRRLGDAALLRNCAGGAFMENRFGGQRRDGAATSSAWREHDPLAPCRAATPRDLWDVCAAWSVRDVDLSQRLTWCQSALPPDVSTRACRIAVGVIAPPKLSGRAMCNDDAACWYGRGYAWAMLGWQSDDASRARGCLAAARPLAASCAAGAGFRRAATLEMSAGHAADLACQDELGGALRASCMRGAHARDQPIAYA